MQRLRIPVARWVRTARPVVRHAQGHGVASIRYGIQKRGVGGLRVRDGWFSHWMVLKRLARA